MSSQDEAGEGPDWLAAHGHPWTAGPPQRLHENPWFALDVYAGVAPTGVAATYYLLHYRNTATGVVPLHDDGTVTLVGQWRFPFRQYSWELPEGGAPLGEAPEDGARRELREEAGLLAGSLRHILELKLSNASSDETAHLYLATDLVPTATERDATEALATARVPFAEALAAVATGRITDAMTVAALLRVHHMAVTGEIAADLAARLLGDDTER
jgi:8-oxo-dGDP phosphatase